MASRERGMPPLAAEAMNKNPLITFYKLIPGIRSPKRAERSAAGYLPSRAMRYCDALTSATGYGYWIFPPMDFSLIWDGESVRWSMDDGEQWLPLTGTSSGAVQFPGYAETFDGDAPAELRGYSPPFLTALPELGGVQIWTGLIAKTRPGWSIGVRSPVNLPPIPGLTAWEGVVETDIWRGPLFNNFRITKTDVPVHIKTGAPFMQVQPIPQIAYREETLSSQVIGGVGDLQPEDWSQLANVLLPSEDHEERQGLYAVTVRKRRLCPVADRVGELAPTVES